LTTFTKKPEGEKTGEQQQLPTISNRGYQEGRGRAEEREDASRLQPDIALKKESPLFLPNLGNQKKSLSSEDEVARWKKARQC